MTDLVFGGSGIFLPCNLDDPNHVEPAGEIRFCAQRVFAAFWTSAEQTTLAGLPGRAERGTASCATCEAIWGALIPARAPHMNFYGTMEIIDHAATTDDKGRVASDAGRGRPQYTIERRS